MACQFQLSQEGLSNCHTALAATHYCTAPCNLHYHGAVAPLLCCSTQSPQCVGTLLPLHYLSGQPPSQGVLATAFVTWPLASLLQWDAHSLLPMGFADHDGLMGSG